MTRLRTLLRAAELSSHTADELMSRALAEMKQHAELLDELERLDRHRMAAQSAYSSFVVEAAFAMKDVGL